MTELTTIEPAVAQQDVSLLATISRAAQDATVDVGKMERLMAMYERMEAKRAETALNDAMSDAQAEMEPISADALNPQTKSRYATYAKLDRALRPIYTKHGFALSFNTSADAPEGFVRVLCYVSHKAGHSRTYHIDMPTDGKGAKGNDVMTKTHAVGSGAQYGMRYLLKMIFNVAIGEGDDDGNAAAADPHTAWLAAVEECTTDAEVTARATEMVEKFGGVNKVPHALRSACQRKRESFKAKAA